MPTSFAEHDVAFMRRALQLAKRGRGRVEPNPVVGCVLVKGRTIVGEGYHQEYGRHHAEVNALGQAGRRSAGSTAYVTLEPCCHTGKTPPCTQALVDAGVTRVVAALRDPYEEVAGRGLHRLAQAGVQVDVGLLETEAAELNAPYLTLLQRQRPYTILKWAQTLDGKIATRTGHSQWISSEASRKVVHRLRARVDGILVGIGTVLADDPLLTARDVPIRRNAARIILDSNLRVPLDCKLVATAEIAPVIVFASRQASDNNAPKAANLRRRSVEVVSCRTRKGRVDIGAALAQLSKRRMTNLLVEGGSAVLSAFLDARLADEAYIFVAPRLIGGTNAPTAYAGTGSASIDQGVSITQCSLRRLGPDAFFRLRLAAT